MRQAEKISVIMCTFNGAKFLREQLDTLVGQTWPLHELLVFDDASGDDTWTILEEYAARFPVMRISRNRKNIGYSANFKQALLAASGDAIAIADQDDVWAKDKIKKMLAKWDDNSLLIYCDSIRFNKQLPVKAVPSAIYRRFEGTDARKIFLFNTVSGHALMIRKELLSIAFPFSDTIFYDWWLAVVAAYNGGVYYVKETLVFQRMHDENITGNKLDHTKKDQRGGYKRMALEHLKEFKHAPRIPEKDQAFAIQFEEALEASLKTKFHLPLFVLMVKYRNVLFNYKVKKIGLFSFIKHAFRLTYNYDL